jgi:alpha-D-ribose 1-methylphosphonate 5-triphosphate diphosphatase PhnM
MFRRPSEFRTVDIIDVKSFDKFTPRSRVRRKKIERTTKNDRKVAECGRTAMLYSAYKV